MKTIRRRKSIVTERYQSTVIRLQPGVFQMCPGCDECRDNGNPDPNRSAAAAGSFHVRRSEDGTMILCPGRNTEE